MIGKPLEIQNGYEKNAFVVRVLDHGHQKREWVQGYTDT